MSESSLNLPRPGQSFQVEEALEAAKALTEFLRNHVDRDSPLAVTIVVNYIENCSQSGGAGELDLVYRTVVAGVPRASGLTLESRLEQQADPPKSVGALSDTHRLSVVPQFRYNLADHFQYGAQAQIDADGGFFDTLELTWLNSSTSRFASAAVSGTRTYTNDVLAKVQWRLSWVDSQQPTDVQRLESRKLTVQGAAQTRPFGRMGAVLRFGASVEGGDQRNDIGVIDSKTATHTRYGAMRSYAGVSFNTKQHSFSGSYGLLLGTVPGNGKVDYRKHLADAAYVLRYSGFDHRPIEIESRFTAGVLQTVHAAPAAERFYGGNESLSFIEGDDWDFRANPVIRSIPKNYFNRVSELDRSGGENFAALNLTASIPVWRLPLIPTSISRLPEFRSGLQSARETGLQQAIVYYRSKDPAQKEAGGDVAEVESSMAGLLMHLREIEPMIPEDLSEPGADCIDALDAAPDLITAATKETGVGPVASFIIPKVLTACRDDLNATLKDTMIESESMRLEALQETINAKVARVDQAAAEAKAHEDLDYAFRAFDMFVDEINIVSISPVVIFDAARMGAQGNDVPEIGFRYGAGVGGRVSIMNAINVTAGYAWNPNPRSWEKPGALFFSFDIVDLLR